MSALSFPRCFECHIAHAEMSKIMIVFVAERIARSHSTMKYAMYSSFVASSYSCGFQRATFASMIGCPPPLTPRNFRLPEPSATPPTSSAVTVSGQMRPCHARCARRLSAAGASFRSRARRKRSSLPGGSGAKDASASRNGPSSDSSAGEGEYRCREGERSTSGTGRTALMAVWRRSVRVGGGNATERSERSSGVPRVGVPRVEVDSSQSTLTTCFTEAGLEMGLESIWGGGGEGWQRGTGADGRGGCGGRARQ
jgi:hypothetical protein